MNNLSKVLPPAPSKGGDREGKLPKGRDTYARSFSCNEKSPPLEGAGGRTTQRSIVLLISLLTLLFVFPACKAKKDASANLKRKSTTFLVEKLQGNQIQAEWFSSKARIVPSGFGVGMTVSANIRVRRDSAIWMNVSKIGLEAGRALIRPDSVFILDRLNRTYYARPLAYVESEFNLPADFNLLQEMILGNAILLDENNVNSKKLTDRYILTANDDDYQTEYRLGAAPYLLEEMSVNDDTNQRSFSIDFDEYKKVNQYNFSHRRDIELSSEETGDGTIKINFSKVEIDVPKSMPFSVSSRYERG